MPIDSDGRVYHSNHLLGRHQGVEEPGWLKDTVTRVERIKALATKLGRNTTGLSWEEFSQLFDDHEGFPCSICRWEPTSLGMGGSLFNIVMELTGRRAIVRLGRPCQVECVVELRFDR